MTLPVRHPVGQTGRWDPLQEFEELYQQMGRLLPSTLTTPTEHRPWVPPTDLSEDDNAYVVELELPGVKLDDINIQVSGNELAVTGEAKERERVGLLRRRTRRLGQFEYRVTLPKDVDTNKIEATLAEGVLSIRIPKTERSKPRRVEITQS